MKQNGVNTVSVLPWQQTNNRSAMLRVLGYIFRALLAFMCAYGLCRFIFDSLALAPAYGTVFGTCAAACFVFSLMISGRHGLAAGGAACGGLVLFLALREGSFFAVLYGCGVSLYNAWNKRLDALEYGGASGNIIDLSKTLETAGYSEAELLQLAAMLAAVLLSAICVICILRRVRLLPILFVGALASTLIHYFGACDNNFGFALMLASLCGLISLAGYDNIFVNRKTVGSALGTDPRLASAKDELSYTLRVGSELGGFTGLAAALAALAVIAVPMKLDTAMPDIPNISEPAHRAEDYVSAVVGGHAPAPSGLFFLGTSGVSSRVTEAKEREADGERIFDVQTDVNIPIYLRSWVGRDYSGDSWHTASYSHIAEYRKIFGSGFSAELLTYELLYALDPNLVTIPEGRKYSARTDFGYINAPVHIKKLSYLGNDVFLPSYTDQRTGLLKHGSDERHTFDYSNYYDGIFDSSTFIFVDSYTVLAQLGLAPTEEMAKNIATLVGYYADQYTIIGPLREMRGNGASEDELRAEYDRLFAKSNMKYYLSSTSDPTSSLVYPISVSNENITTVSGNYIFPLESLAFRYAYRMSEEERLRVDALMDNLPLYYEYVYDNYLSPCEGSERFEWLINRIAEEANLSLRRNASSYTGRHRIVEAVIDYLSENMVYTLEPKSPSSERKYLNAAETFLFDTKEGYCVQYATAAVMLLRAAGIPARYADGYIAQNFVESRDEAAVGDYRALVLDENAHAWIEVYYDYYGWVRYEATAPYVTEQEDIVPPDDPEPEDTDYFTPKVEPEVTETVAAPEITISSDNATTEAAVDIPEAPADTRRPIAAGVIIAVVILAALAIVLLMIKHRFDSAAARLRALIKCAADGDFDGEERLTAALELGERIMKLLRFERLTPRAGEPQSEFAARVNDLIGDMLGSDFVPVISAIEAAEFGSSVSTAELRLIARYLDVLIRVTAHLGSIPRRILRRYVVIM
ncbi:MAG: hypothetical protein IJ428_05895 [Clostridia bacterium]|nr:hypothetical protein [Clostridia bacterium]